MLVLSRKSDEEILIGDNIRIVVHRIHGNRVRLGIDAPHGMPILRGELASGFEQLLDGEEVDDHQVVSLRYAR